jgi:radical SAM superfamily enzyme YgiQ (UPF0313 family)
MKSSKEFDAVIFTDGQVMSFHYKTLGAYRVATELRNAGYSVLVIDFFGEWCAKEEDLYALLKKCISSSTKMVGYASTFFTWSVPEDNKTTYRSTRNALELSFFPTYYEKIAQYNSFIKELSPNAKIVYGGNRASEVNEELYNVGLDYIVRGLADKMIVDLMDEIVSGRGGRFSDVVQGVKIIDYDFKGAMFDFTQALTRYEPEDFISANEVLPLETSRGCIFKCSFCEYPLLGRKASEKGYHKTRDILTREFADNYEKLGVSNYIFVDDTFNESTEKLLEINAAIKDSGVPVRFFAYLRADLVKAFPEQIELLKEMGLQTAFYGIETLNPKAARAIGKGGDIEALKKSITHSKDVWGDDVLVFGSFIFGLPYEDEASINEWMSWVYQSNLDCFAVNPLYLVSSLWKSEITRNPEKYGYTFTSKEADFGWVNNQGLTQAHAKLLSEKWMDQSLRSHRLTASAWQAMLLQKYNISINTLCRTPRQSVEWQAICKNTASEWEEYKAKVFSLWP